MKHDSQMKDHGYFWIYILRCTNGHLYTGYTKNLVCRYLEHQDGKGNCKFTRMFPPVKIEQCWRIYESKGTALKVERFIKQRKKSMKLKFIDQPGLLRDVFSEESGNDVNIHPFDGARVLALVKKTELKNCDKSMDPFQHI